MLDINLSAVIGFAELFGLLVIEKFSTDDVIFPFTPLQKFDVFIEL
jgi:hypothetical protein